MEFEIDQAHFSAALSLASTVADRRSSMPILANVLLRATSESQLVCSATDTMIALTERVPAEVLSTGALTLGVRHLLGVVKTLPEGNLKLKALDNHWAEIVSGRSEFKLMGMAETDFPQLPEPKGAKFVSVDAAELGDLIQKTQFSVSHDEARVNLNGLLYECDGKNTVMVSTDGHRLTKIAAPVAGPTLEAGLIVPRKGLVELRRVLDRVEGTCELSVSKQHLFVRANDVTLSIKLNDVAFPPYDQVIPKDYSRRVRVERDELLHAMRRAAVMAPEKTATVRIELGKNSLQLSAENPDLGAAHQEVPVEYTGKGLVAGFNAHYLIELLEAIDETHVFLDFQGELDPCVVRPADGADYLGVVMPMRI